MDLHEISAKICALMGSETAKEIKCGIRFNTTSSKEQYVTFSVFCDYSREEIKNIDFYEFHTGQQRAEKMEKIELLLSGDMTALYNTSNFN